MHRSDEGRVSRRAEYLAVSAIGREHRHRLVLATGIVSLVVLTFGPVFGHHVAGDVGAGLAGWDHVGRLCLVALHLLFEPVHTGFHVLFGAGLLYAVADRVRAWWTMRRALAPLATLPVVPGDAFACAASAVGLPLDRLRVADGLPNPAFTVGWWRPVVYVARALPSRLSTTEFAAVIAHEAAHVRRRDPLRLSLLRFLACTLFWVPAFRRLAADVADDAEILADDAAARDDPLVLASALVRVARWGGDPGASDLPRGAVALVRGDLLDRRVRRLLGDDTVPTTHVTRRSVAAALFALGVLWVSSVSVVHPLPGAASAERVHCEDHGEFPLTHLFCGLGAHGPRDRGVCPHGLGGHTGHSGHGVTGVPTGG